MSRGDRAASEAGFSLVETVVAFAILSLVVSGAIQIVGGGSRRARGDQDRAIALVHAQSRMALLGATAELSAGMTEGSFDDGFGWRLSARPRLEHGAARALMPWDIEIEVARPRIAASKVVLRTVLLAKPAGAP